MKHIVFSSLCVLLAAGAMSSCNFEEVNTNKQEMSEKEGYQDGIFAGGLITAMQKNVVPVGTQADGTDIVNQYQTAYNLAADGWSGYFGQNNNWGGANNLNYGLKEGWVSDSYRNSYSNILPIWKDLKAKAEKAGTPEVFALAQILKISAWHKATDMFGPIPYKHAGEPLLVVPYDSQQDVYKYFLEDLTTAITELTKKVKEGAKVMQDFDAVYAGDTRKWVKYANSLMLRLAMRIRYADPTIAQKYAEMAVNNEIGVMTEKDDQAMMSKGAGLSFINNIDVLANQYNECRMGASMFSYLGGYQDPRLPAYFKVSGGSMAQPVGTLGNYAAIPAGHTSEANDDFKACSLPNIVASTPVYWMRASEIYFLRAEGALIGWSMQGTPDDLYKRGVEMSFVENGLSASDATEYMKSTATPRAYSYSWYSFPAPTTATPQFAGSDEQKLEKIMIQKWIALYPNGQEAWSEQRRTGYPKLIPLIRSMSSDLKKDEMIRRMVYPTNTSSSQGDLENLENARQMLGGPDKISTRLWWDCKH